MLPDGVMMIFHFKPTLRSDVSVQQLLLITVKYSVILYYTTSCSKTEYAYELCPLVDIVIMTSMVHLGFYLAKHLRILAAS